MGETVIIEDRAFFGCVHPQARLLRLYEGCHWAEGPAYFSTSRRLLWSDIPSNRILCLDENTGRVSIFRAPSGFANGNARDRDGRLVTCEHGGRRVTRTEADGAITVLADRYAGGLLNSPNDLVVRSDGTVWFTDPSYGLDSPAEGGGAISEQNGRHVYRIDPSDGSIDRILDDFDQPNGLAFSPDETRLYVVDSGGAGGRDGPRHIRVFDIAPNGQIGGGSVFAVCDAGVFDGLKVDADGRVWTSASDGVHCFTPNGELIGRIPTPERVANLAFGGPTGKRLYICASTSLYAIDLAVRGASFD